MDENFQRLLRSLEAGRREFEIEISINENGRFPAVDLSVSALNRVLFCGWTARLLDEYIDYLASSFQEKDIARSAVEFFHEQIVARVHHNGWSWVDCFEHSDELYLPLKTFYDRLVFDRRIAWIDDLLRLEVTSMYKVNPSKYKTTAKGSETSTTILATALAAAILMQQAGVEECRDKYMEFAQEQTELVLKQARFEGRLTEQHQQVLAAQNAQMAACRAAIFPWFDDAVLSDYGVALLSGEIEIEDLKKGK